MNRGYQDQHFKEADNGNVRTCIHHFHPSVITMDENGKYRLKTRAAPALYLTLFSMQNNKFKEESRLSRRIRLSQDLEYADDQ